MSDTEWPGIYVAGSMSGLPEFNYPAFYQAAEQLAAVGHTRVVNPAALGDGDTGRPWDFYMRQGITGLLTCDKVALLPDWEQSTGARLEAHIAQHLKMTVAPLSWWLR